jgi:hypothetical protein
MTNTKSFAFLHNTQYTVDKLSFMTFFLGGGGGMLVFLLRESNACYATPAGLITELADVVQGRSSSIATGTPIKFSKLKRSLLSDRRFSADSSDGRKLSARGPRVRANSAKVTGLRVLGGSAC